jgi:hypothetical protein
MRATITDLQPPRVLETRGEWGAGGESVAAELRWELAEDGDATVLRFTNTVDSSGEAVTGTAAGWHYHLDALAAVLDGGEVDLADPSAPWEPIHDAYERREREG